MRNGRVDSSSFFDALTVRCAVCSQPVDEREIVPNVGELVFHSRCAPGCSICGRVLGVGEAGWRLEGVVVSEPFGWAVRPTRCWCPACLGRAIRDRPSGLD